MEVDHFNPHLKHTKRNAYSNLMPAIRPCNGKKRDLWPTPEMQKEGIHFINPCKEDDYGVQIFEILESGKLVGTTPAARYHIRSLDLNAPFLMRERKIRTNFRRFQNDGVWDFKSHWQSHEALAAGESFCDFIEKSITPIPALPPQFDERGMIKSDTV